MMQEDLQNQRFVERTMSSTLTCAVGEFPVFIHRGYRRLVIDGILCVPGEEFLRNMMPARGLTDFGRSPDAAESR